MRSQSEPVTFNKSVAFERRNRDIDVVRSEKDSMVKVAHEILALIEGYPRSRKELDELEIRKKLMEFTNHLSIIGGFCDRGTKLAILNMQLVITQGVIAPSLSAGRLRMIMAIAIGIQVDFTAHPFRAVGFDVKALGARLKAFASRE